MATVLLVSTVDIRMFWVFAFGFFGCICQRDFRVGLVGDTTGVEIF